MMIKEYQERKKTEKEEAKRYAEEKDNHENIMEVPAPWKRAVELRIGEKQ